MEKCHLTAGSIKGGNVLYYSRMIMSPSCCPDTDTSRNEAGSVQEELQYRAAVTLRCAAG